MDDPRGFLRRLLRQEIVLSYGCTEPAAIALAAAGAAAAARGEIRALTVHCDVGTFKNALAVGLPGTSHRGPAYAAAAGAVAANPHRRLAVLADLGEGEWARAEELVRRQITEVTPQPEVRGVRIEARAESPSGSGLALIEGRHDRLIRLERNGERLPLFPSAEDDADAVEQPSDEVPDSEIRQHLATATALVGLLDYLEPSDLEFLREGVEVNRQIAQESLDAGLGLGIGRAMLRALGPPAPESVEIAAAAHAKAWVAAGVEARMAGHPAPVMTSGGSGNSGMTVTLGTWAAAEALGIAADRWQRALALAHLVNLAVKSRIGRVGPLCGGATASSLGVGCAVAWMLSGDVQAVDRTIRIGVNSVAGSLCDGAKPACALRIACGLGSAIEAAFLSIAAGVRCGDSGLAGRSASDSLERLYRLALTAYPDSDPAIAAILQSGR